MELKAGYKQTDVGVIPEEWECVKVKGLASSARNAIVGGPFGSDLVSNDYVNFGVPVIRGQNLGAKLVSGNFAFVSPEKADALEANLARPEDVVFTQRGTLGQVSIVPTEPFDRYVVSQSQMKISLNRKAADPLFIYYVFISSPQQSCILRSAIQTGVPHLNLTILRGFSVQLPPLPEQCAIAAALNDMDELINAQDELITKKRDIKQATMQQLLTGKKRLPGFSGDWEAKKLGEVGKFSKGKGLAKEDVSASGNVPAIPYTAIYTDFDEIINFEDIKNFTSSTSTIFIDNPHLLIAGSSNMLANIGKVCAYVDQQKVAIGGDIILYQTSENLHFLSYLLSTQPHRKKIVFLSQGSTIRHVYSSTFMNYEVELPELEEQTAIAAVLCDIDDELRVLEVQRDKTRSLKQGMMQELLTGRIRLV